MRDYIWCFLFTSSLMLVSCGGGSDSSADFEPEPGPDPVTVFSTEDAFPTLPSLSNPVAAFQAPGDSSRWFVVEQDGQIQVFENEPMVSDMETFLDISARVDSSGSESGLLGMAFHPNFTTNGEVFVSYTETGSPLTSIISRFISVDGGLTLDDSSEEVVLRIDQDLNNHNGGQISFGPDGYLYFGMGDGGGAGDPLDRGEDPRNLLGTVLRIDVDGGSPYAIPPGNPFFGNDLCPRDHSSTTNCPEIFAWGFRNPWRWSFDRQTGELWLGDVGQETWEEVDIVEVGNDYGWDRREGANCFEPEVDCETASLVDPVVEYDHSEGLSITGGYVYRGAQLPELFGDYIVGDFVVGSIWTVSPDGTGGFDRELLLEADFNIASFAEAEDGELLIVDYSGRLHRIVAEQLSP